jgi:hypothetical protein
MKLDNKYQLTTIIAKVQNLTFMYKLNSDGIEEIIGLKDQNMCVIQYEDGKVVTINNEIIMVAEYTPIEEVDKDNNKKNNK